MFEEIRTELHKLQTEEQDLRKFGYTMAWVFTFFTLITWIRATPSFPYLFLLAMAFWFVGSIWPLSLKRLYVAWMSLAIAMGTVMTKVILSLLFYTAFTVIGVIARMFHPDRLDEQFQSDAESYWIPKKAPADLKTHLERQF